MRKHDDADDDPVGLLPSSRKNPYYGIYDSDDGAAVAGLKRSGQPRLGDYEGIHVNRVLNSIDASSYFAKRRDTRWDGSLRDYVDSVWHSFSQHRDKMQLERNLLSCGYVSLNNGVELEDLRRAIDELDHIEYEIAATSTQAETTQRGDKPVFGIVDARLRNQMARYTEVRNRLVACLRVSSADRATPVHVERVAPSTSIHDMVERKAVFQHLTQVMHMLDTKIEDKMDRKRALMSIEARLRTVTSLCEIAPAIIDEDLFELCTEVVRRVKRIHPTIDC